MLFRGKRRRARYTRKESHAAYATATRERKSQYADIHVIAGYYIKRSGGRGALFAYSVSLTEVGGVERKLALALVRSFFALSIGDNIRFLSQSSLGNYHWLRTRRLLRLQKTNSSLAPLPLRFAAHCEAPSLSTPRKASPPLGDGLADVTSGRAASEPSRKCKARSRTAPSAERIAFRCGDFGMTCPRRQSNDCRAGLRTPKSPI